MLNCDCDKFQINHDFSNDQGTCPRCGRLTHHDSKPIDKLRRLEAYLCRNRSNFGITVATFAKQALEIVTE